MRTLEFTGNRTVPILSCGGDKQSFTVILAVKANREKLPSKVIFKGVRQLQIQIPPTMQVWVHKKGWMDEEGIFLFLFIFSCLYSVSFSFVGTKDWIRKNLRFTPHQRALLVWDSFRGHLTDAVKDLLVRRNVDVAVIPSFAGPRQVH